MTVWFSGSIADAIKEAKRRQTLFIVHVRDESEKSTKMDEDVWQKASIKSFMEDTVAIEIKQSTEPFTQFTQFYPVMVLPSTYFISPDGIPLEIVADDCSEASFLEKAKSTLAKFKESKTLNSVTDPSGGSPTTAVQSTSTSSADLEQKKRYAQQKLEEIRKRKEAEAKEAEIEAERKRRAQLSELVKAKEETETKEVKQLLEERKKEKEEDRIAREQIKQRIAQDRAERAAKFAKSKEESLGRPASQSTTPKISTPPVAPPSFDGNVRIQLRFPDGSHQNTTSRAESTLSDVCSEIRTNFSDRVGASFTLAVPYPKRVFTEDEMSKTLDSLNLIPSTVLVILPNKSNKNHLVISTSNSADSGNVFMKLIALIVSFFAFISSLFTGRRDQPVGGTSQNNGANGNNIAMTPNSARNNTDVGASSGSNGDTGGLRKRTALETGVNKSKSATKVERGNIHRLNTTSGNEDDDENNTWNGNSTQQM